jgi:hypothetical protein
MFIPTTAQQQKDNSSRFVVVKLMLTMQMPSWRKQFTQFTQRTKEKFYEIIAAILNDKVCKIKTTYTKTCQYRTRGNEKHSIKTKH